jgi:uncharacterized protein YndB with AHSA1/START domain
MVPPSGKLTLEMKRVFPAAPLVVFAAFSDPEKPSQVVGAGGLHCPAPRVRSARRSRLPDRDAAVPRRPFYLAGEFREVDPPALLVFAFVYEAPDPDDVETLVELSFRDRGESTEVVYSPGPFKSAARRALHLDG